MPGRTAPWSAQRRAHRLQARSAHPGPRRSLAAGDRPARPPARQPASLSPPHPAPHSGPPCPGHERQCCLLSTTAVTERSRVQVPGARAAGDSPFPAQPSGTFRQKAASRRVPGGRRSRPSLPQSSARSRVGTDGRPLDSLPPQGDKTELSTDPNAGRLRGRRRSLTSDREQLCIPEQLHSPSPHPGCGRPPLTASFGCRAGVGERLCRRTGSVERASSPSEAGREGSCGAPAGLKTGALGQAMLRGAPPRGRSAPAPPPGPARPAPSPPQRATTERERAQARARPRLPPQPHPPPRPPLKPSLKPPCRALPRPRTPMRTRLDGGQRCCEAAPAIKVSAPDAPAPSLLLLCFVRCFFFFPPSGTGKERSL